MSRNEGTLAWGGLFLGVIIYDLWAIRTHHQTLSAAFYEAVHHPQRRWLVILAWSGISYHLFGLDRFKLGDIFRLVEWSESE